MLFSSVASRYQHCMEQGHERFLRRSRHQGGWGQILQLPFPLWQTGKPVIASDAPNDPRAKGVPEGHPPLNAFWGSSLFQVWRSDFGNDIGDTCYLLPATVLAMYCWWADEWTTIRMCCSSWSGVSNKAGVVILRAIYDFLQLFLVTCSNLLYAFAQSDAQQELGSQVSICFYDQRYSPREARSSIFLG
jgi:hypothetical protein